MTDLHELARRAVAAGDVDDRTADHVATCAACAGFAARVERLTDVAKLLAPPAPPVGLADRVLAALPGTRRATTLAGPVRRGVVRSVAVAAAALLVAGIAALVPGDGGESSLLLTAAEATEDAGTARVRVEGTTEVEVARGDRPAPDLDAVPDEMQAYFERRWQELYAEFERQYAAFQAQVDATLADAQRQIDRAMEDAMRQFGRAPGPRPAPSAPTTPTTRPAGQAPQPPDRVAVGVRVSASGEVAFDGRLRLDGTVTAGTGRAGFEVRADGGRPLVRQPDGRWVEVGDASGALASLLARPDGVARLLRSATGEVEQLGEEALAGGVRVRHVRFEAKGFGTAEVWLDDDDRVRRATVHSSGPLRGGSYRSTVTAELADFGVGVAPPERVRASGRATAPATPSRLVYPLGPAVAASLEAG